jgi:hypothetical protein
MPWNMVRAKSLSSGNFHSNVSMTEGITNADKCYEDAQRPGTDSDGNYFRQEVRRASWRRRYLHGERV